MQNENCKMKIGSHNTRDTGDKGHFAFCILHFAVLGTSGQDMVSETVCGPFPGLTGKGAATLLLGLVANLFWRSSFNSSLACFKASSSRGFSSTSLAIRLLSASRVLCSPSIVSLLVLALHTSASKRRTTEMRAMADVGEVRIRSFSSVGSRLTSRRAARILA